MEQYQNNVTSKGKSTSFPGGEGGTELQEQQQQQKKNLKNTQDCISLAFKHTFLFFLINETMCVHIHENDLYLSVFIYHIFTVCREIPSLKNI